MYWWYKLKAAQSESENMTGERVFTREGGIKKRIGALGDNMTTDKCLKLLPAPSFPSAAWNGNNKEFCNVCSDIYWRKTTMIFLIETADITEQIFLLKLEAI